MMDISFALLSGGMGRRFNSDKTKAELMSKPLYHYGLELGLQLSDDVLHISRDKNKYKPFMSGVRFIEDAYENQCPLAGLLTALKNIKHKKVFILSADTPLIDKNIADLIIAKSSGYDITLPQINDKIYNLVAVYDKKVYEVFHDRYVAEEYKIIEGLKFFNVNVLTNKIFNDEKINMNKFLNINKIEDLETAKQILNK